MTIIDRHGGQSHADRTGLLHLPHRGDTLGLAVAETVELTTKKKAEIKADTGKPLKKEDLPKDAQPPPTHTNQQPPKP